MSVINTVKWFDNADNTAELSKYVLPLFEGAHEKMGRGILVHLSSHGMFRNWKDGKSNIKKLKEQGFYQKAAKEINFLKKEWNGPDVPVIILPVDEQNRRLRAEFGSKSGLAFPDKIFLFLSPDNSNSSIAALITHEYNHICRLNKMNKDESDITLLDTLILEGLAEAAVNERFGKKETAKWTAYYNNKQLDQFFERWIKPNIDVRQEEGSLIQRLLYGRGPYPQMMGYAVGYRIVKDYMERSNKKIKQLLTLSSEKFLH
ncbi:DUF2268 domain-containing protein [Bacillus gobiensis]|uniref:DUF2268 domain-containing protein n=1 Tax=Bacillus gobiensis TaxID=1441095 RepID=UPI003D1D46E9